MTRLPVKKTYKLYIGGAFPRSESGRTYEAEGQNVARASRKDVRDAVRAARGAFPKWAGMTAYNRGQVLYRLAEMLESRVGEFAELCSGREEVESSIDRIVWYAGWSDKLAQVLGASNPVAGPYFNFTCEPTGVVGVVVPKAAAARDRLAPRSDARQAARPSCSRQRRTRSRRSVRRGHRDIGCSGRRREPADQLSLRLAPWLASHVANALDLPAADADLERAAADSVKRVHRGGGDKQTPWRSLPS